MKTAIIFFLLAMVIICLVMAAGVWWLARDLGIHRRDDSQVPVITVSDGLRPTITFTPNAAYELAVYEGSEDGDGFGVIWSARGSGGFENNLHSPVIYGTPPKGSEGPDAPPLEPGKTYTITIFRKDPKGGGDGFLNSRHRYVGVITFVATE